MTSTEVLPVPGASPMTIHIARPAAAVSTTGVIVAHELFAVNPDIQGILDDLAAAGHLAIAPEFYHRQAPPGRWFARDDDGRRESFALLHGLGRDDAVDDVSAAIAWLRLSRASTRSR